MGVFLLIYRPLLFSTFDPLVAEARGVPVRLLAVLFFDPGGRYRFTGNPSHRSIADIHLTGRSGGDSDPLNQTSPAGHFDCDGSGDKLCVD